MAFHLGMCYILVVLFIIGLSLNEESYYRECKNRYTNFEINLILNIQEVYSVENSRLLSHSTHAAVRNFPPLPRSILLALHKG